MCRMQMLTLVRTFAAGIYKEQWLIKEQAKVFKASCADPERGRQGVHPPPLKNHKSIGFLSNTGLDPLKKHKNTKPAFNVGQTSARQRNTI